MVRDQIGVIVTPWTPPYWRWSTLSTPQSLSTRINYELAYEQGRNYEHRSGIRLLSMSQPELIVDLKIVHRPCCKWLKMRDGDEQNYESTNQLTTRMNTSINGEIENGANKRLWAIFWGSHFSLCYVHFWLFTSLDKVRMKMIFACHIRTEK